MEMFYEDDIGAKYEPISRIYELLFLVVAGTIVIIIIDGDNGDKHYIYITISDRVAPESASLLLESILRLRLALLPAATYLRRTPPKSIVGCSSRKTYTELLNSLLLLTAVLLHFLLGALYLAM
ncbi:hypothetical protein GN956_G21938 [Arapaima gigas]